MNKSASVIGSIESVNGYMHVSVRVNSLESNTRKQTPILKLSDSNSIFAVESLDMMPYPPKKGNKVSLKAVVNSCKYT